MSSRSRTGTRGSRPAAPALAGALLGAALIAWPAGPLPAQVTGQVADTLDAVETALDSGQADRARALLEAWRRSSAAEGGASREERSRARFLQARLTADADTAEELYLELAMEGDSRYGDRAWLRLAQLHLARGEAGRARYELERLRSDYPGSPLTGESWYWTGLAASTEGDRSSACGAWRRAAAAGGEAAGLAGSALPSCREGGGEIPVAGPPAGAEAGDEADAPRDAADEARRAPERGYAAQLGAFRERSGAEAMAERARAVGFEVRIVGPAPEDGLLRVRTGTVAARSRAEELVRRLRDRDLPGMVVEIEGSESGAEVDR